MMSFSGSTILLYCFPYAGGNSQIYREWQQYFPNIKIRPIELPGHGKRLSEPLMKNYQKLIELLTLEVIKDIRDAQRANDNVHYAGFGHSAGAALNFGVCARVSKRLQQPPLHCFLSAGLPPHQERKNFRDMDTEKFEAEMNLPQDVLAQPELLQYVIPIMYADYVVYQESAQDNKLALDCPFTLFAADQDKLISQEHMWTWNRYTSHPVEKIVLQGDHLSIVRSPQKMITHIQRAFL